MRPDLILFSGDLVFSGEDHSSFSSARTRFIDRVLASTGLTRESLFIAPGNHDVSRRAVRSDSFVEAGARATLTSDVLVNEFIDGLVSGDSASGRVIERLDNFYKFVRSEIDVSPVVNDPLLRVFVAKKGDLRVGIACFDTAWRATGKSDNVDRNKLILGERHIDKAIAAIETADIKIAMLHHPLNWLAEFDEVVVSNRLYYGFDLLACGHVHDSAPQTTLTPNGGSIISQTGCLYKSRKYFNGYQFITIDLAGEEAEFFIRSYYDKRRAFDVDPKTTRGGRFKVPFRAKAAIAPSGRVHRALRLLRGLIRQTASDQISMREAQGTLHLDAKEAFVCPPLSRHVLAHEPRVGQADVVGATKEPEIIPLEKLLRGNQNLVVFGPREAGKSSLAQFIAVNVAEGLIDRPRIPVVIDFRQFKRNSYGLKKAINAYTQGLISAADTEGLLTSGDFLFIVDNLDCNSSSEKAEVERIIAGIRNARWIVFVQSHSTHVLRDDKLNSLAGFDEIHIQQLPRKSIRELSRRWCEQTGHDSEKTYRTVMNQLRVGNLPRTGFIVTLLLWSVYQKQRQHGINEAILLTGVVDVLLGKTDLSSMLYKDCDPKAHEITLQHVSLFLRQRDGIADVNDVTECLIVFFRERGLHYKAYDVLENSHIYCNIGATWR